MTDPTGETAELARLRAAERLAAAGQVPDAEWRRVVETFPREEFAPGLWVARGAAWAYLDGSDDADRAEWLREVYAGGPMVVALADATRLDGPERLYSGRVEVATVPVARYLAALHALNPRPGHRILELGLGAGIGAGMIAHHLAPYRRSSDPPVVAVEVDPDLAETAAKRLARLGYAVQVHTGDALAADLP
ncbi:MAG: hypothetical protein HOV68_31885, partial [Streptomycetaceae bacterium]|nr:hypothetical protein [Streptomycetaceae bacterium]